MEVTDVIHKDTIKRGKFRYNRYQRIAENKEVEVAAVLPAETTFDIGPAHRNDSIHYNYNKKEDSAVLSYYNDVSTDATRNAHDTVLTDIPMNRYASPLNLAIDRTVVEHILTSGSIDAEKVTIDDALINMVRKALTHKSFFSTDEQGKNMNKQHRFNTYERLEFFGDSALNCLLSHYLMTTFPNVMEGALSKFRIALVECKTLSNICTKMNFGRFIQIGKSAEERGIRYNRGVQEDIIESLCGTIFLSLGFNIAYKWIVSMIETNIDLIELIITDTNAVPNLTGAHPDVSIVCEWDRRLNTLVAKSIHKGRNNKAIVTLYGTDRKELIKAIAFETMLTLGNKVFTYERF